MFDASLFSLYAGNNLQIWCAIQGQRVRHSKFGSGTILEIHGDSVENLIFLIQFDQRVESLHGLTDKVKIGKVAFNGAVVSQLALSVQMQEELTKFQEQQRQESQRKQLEKQKERETKQRLQEQQKRERQQIDFETTARQEFQERKKKYQVAWYKDSSPTSLLNEILIRLDDGEKLTPENEKWLDRQKLYPVLAVYYEQLGRLASAGSYWRKAKKPGRAVEITESKTNDPWILTMRAGALRDLGNLDAAEESAKKAIDLSPQYYHPYNALGAIYYQKGKPQEGDIYFQKARTLGAKTIDIDRSIRSALEKASRVHKQQVAKYLYDKDPVRYRWAEYYFNGSGR
jgi:tetratricopeptide (TPR) repeat protein